LEAEKLVRDLRQEIQSLEAELILERSFSASPEDITEAFWPCGHIRRSDEKHCPRCAQ
jgi:hypothetical protein